jgi:hypothetical protein
MSYDPNARLAHFEETGTEPTASEFYRMMRYHEEERRKNERNIEEKKYKKQSLYNQIEEEDELRAKKRNQREGLMATSKFNVKSIMPQVKSLVADKQFAQAEAAGNAGLSVIGDEQTPVNGGRRTRHKKHRGKRSGHKRSGHKRSGHKRSGHKRSGHQRSGHKRSGKRSSKSRRR